MQTELTDWTAHVQGTSWFFGVGIDKYLEFPRLYNAVRDVEDIRELLIARYDVDPEHAITIFDEEATEDNIKGRLHALTQELKPHDKLLIYYSGHGHLSATKRGYWISHDARRGNPARYISNADIRTYLEDSPAKHILLISDSCFSGSLLQSGSMRSTRSVAELEKLPSRWGLCSGRGDEEVWDGEPGQNSPFAQSILDALSSNDQASWNVSKLVEIVTEQTAAHTRQLPQGSPMNIFGHKGGQYVFRKRGSVGSTTMPPESRLEPTQQQGAGAGRDSWAKRKSTSGKKGLHKVGKVMVWVFAALGLLLTSMFMFPSVFGVGPDPLQLQYEMFADGVQFNFIGGTPSYTLTVAAEDEIRYGGELEESGEFAVTFDKFFAYPGDYTLQIGDGAGQVVERSFTIPEPEDLVVGAFHTTSGFDTDNLWPVNQNPLFNPEMLVYVFASISSSREQPLTFRWYDEEANLLFAPEIRSVEQTNGDPFRMMTYQNIRKSGTYVVHLINDNGIIVAETVFGVAGE
ncbi:MAG: caspase family protein [Saprospiraceae bacterium]|nr:caspase family protein [Saprospiraceae bacterium]